MDAVAYFGSKGLRFQTGWRHGFGTGRGRRHSHPSVELVYHLRGEGTTEHEGHEDVRFTGGSVEVYPPDAVHMQDMKTRGEDICILASAASTEGWLDEPIFVPSVDRPDILEDFYWLAGRPPEMDALARLACDRCVTALMLRLLEMKPSSILPGDPVEAYAAHAMDYVRQHFARIRQVKDVADHVGISPDYLRHVFKKTYGIGLKEFLVRTRIERAKSLIIHSRLALKTVAWNCGFRTDRYFSTCFKNMVGCSPGEFRRLHTDHKEERT
jgi:AraC-like DNA-binding protein